MPHRTDGGFGAFWEREVEPEYVQWNRVSQVGRVLVEAVGAVQ